ncbi:MAG: hypothetical protein ICV83_30930 [Cytophagales bacterium]|nr:hypothetical protein [Cytophagales bacterium]
MPTRKEERLKKLIRAVPPEAPTPEFTARVMDDVRAVAGPETAPDPALGALLRRNGLETPSAGFTRAVMEGVAAASPATPATPAGAPIIPVRAWYGVAAVLAGLVAWALASGSAAGPPREAAFWSEAVRGLVRAFSAAVQAVPASFVLVIGALGVLLGIEYVLRYGAGPRAARWRTGG